jgi:hypothetical protein
MPKAKKKQGNSLIKLTCPQTPFFTCSLLTKKKVEDIRIGPKKAGIDTRNSPGFSLTPH